MVSALGPHCRSGDLAPDGGRGFQMVAADGTAATAAWIGRVLAQGLGQVLVSLAQKGRDFQEQDASHHLQGCGAIASVRIDAGCGSTQKKDDPLYYCFNDTEEV